MDTLVIALLAISSGLGLGLGADATTFRTTRARDVWLAAMATIVSLAIGWVIGAGQTAAVKLRCFLSDRLQPVRRRLSRSRWRRATLRLVLAWSRFSSLQVSSWESRSSWCRTDCVMFAAGGAPSRRAIVTFTLTRSPPQPETHAPCDPAPPARCRSSAPHHASRTRLL